MLKRVPSVKTKFTTQEFIKAMCVAWKNQFGSFPKKEQIGVLYSQWGVETGEGKSTWCNNIGNIKAVDDPNKVIEYCALTGVWEIIGGVRVVLSPENPGSWFRAFSTLDEGVFFYLQKMTTRFKSAWPAVESGNPAAFAHLLKLAWYYTAPEADYVKLINFYFKKYMSDNTFEKVIKELNTPVDPPKDTFFDKFKKVFGPTNNS